MTGELFVLNSIPNHKSKPRPEVQTSSPRTKPIRTRDSETFPLPSSLLEQDRSKKHVSFLNNATELAGAPEAAAQLPHLVNNVRRLEERVAPAVDERARLVQGLLRAAVVRVLGRLFRVGFGALRDGDHGGLRPDVDRGAPVQALETAPFYGDDVLSLRARSVTSWSRER